MLCSTTSGSCPGPRADSRSGLDTAQVCGRILHADAFLDAHNSALVHKLSVVLFEGAPFEALDTEREAAQKQKDADQKRAAQVNQVHL